MSDGLRNISGRRIIDVEIEGRTYQFSPMGMQQYAEKESYMLARKGNPLDLLSNVPDGITETLKGRIVDTAVRVASRPMFVRVDEEADFDNSLHGMGWRLWRSLRDTESDFGKLESGEKAVWTSAEGNGYGVSPTQGVQLAIDLLMRIGEEAKAKIWQAIEQSEERDVLPTCPGQKSQGKSTQTV